jgi:hypothetical protein
MLGFSPRLERTIGFILVVKRFSHQINTDEVFGSADVLGKCESDLDFAIRD